MYKVGDKVVYPHHGAGTVVKREKREVLGEKREYLTIKILHNDMTVNVPADNAERVGLRKVIDEEAVKKVVKYLTSGGTEMPKNWNRRFKHNRDKMKTGDIYELAEVVRNLALRDGEKGLSTGEKQMYVKAKKILASELMYAKNMSEDEALEWLEMTLTEGAKPKLTPAERKASAKKPAPTAKSRSHREGRRRQGSTGEGGREEAGRRGEEDDDGGQEAGDSKGHRDPLTWAVLVAAGRGERLGEDRPKAFVRLGALPLLAEPLRRLDESDWIDSVVLVAPPEWEEPAILLAEELGASKVTACVPGGDTRADSVRAGVAEVPDDAAVILVHDAARPLLPDDVIGRVLGALAEGFDGAVPGLPVVDTVKRVRDDAVHETLARDELVTVQTPQAFAAPALRAALRAESNSLLQATDCASLVEANGGRIKVVAGDERLLKVTTRADLDRVAAWLSA